jgi:hypothetical protein
MSWVMAGRDCPFDACSSKRKVREDSLLQFVLNSYQHGRMESHEVIRNALAKAHVKEVADNMGLSLSMVYKWAERSESRKGSGSANPLDRVHDLYENTGDDHLLQWLCNKADGYFVKNPPNTKRSGREVMPVTQEIVQQFADLLAAISHAASDNSICASESEHIRHEWDELKRITERFVKWCEQGDFVHLAEDLKVNKVR